MPLPQITMSLAALFAIMIVILGVQVSLRRAKLKATHGDANDETLRRRIRAHGNFIEYAPLAAVVVGLLEMGGAASAVTLAVAIAFGIARIVHALGMLYTSTPATRAAAMVLQNTAFITSAALLAKMVFDVA